MKKNLMLAAAAVLAGAALASAADAAKPAAKHAPMKHEAGAKSGLVFASADRANFKEVVPGVSKAMLWGKQDGGPYGAFTKFKPGQDNGMHTHTHDTWLVVLKGAYLYKDDAGEKRVGPGDFIRIPGGHKHWSGADAKEGALFYEESNDRFDLIPAK